MPDQVSRGAESAPGLDALGAITDAVEGGAGLPEILRAAARALDASLILIDRSATVLAVAARSPADERSLMRDGDDVTTIELKVADAPVGSLRMRSRERSPDGAVLRLVSTLIASEMERTRAPERASEEAASGFQREVLRGAIADRDDLVARGRELGIDLAGGGTVIVARAHPRVATEDDWRRRLLALGLRGARSVAAGAIGTPTDEDLGGEIVVLVPDADGDTGRRASSAILREIESGLPGFAFAIGRSRHAGDPLELRRAADEALLAINVVEGEAERSELPFEETGTYQLLLPYMSDPAELRRFYEQTVRPLVAYDEQYETDLLGTLATFLECDANVNATAARLFTHRHTIRYRFERVRELTSLDVSSTDGREKLSLGLKAMRVLGIAQPRGPATEPGAEGGRVPR
jgi:PucR family transcriptional regulator, purine catabolism regulatory protein